MDLFQLKLFQRMSERMGWLGARQEVLAQNIANADTPDYQPRDLKDFDFRRDMRNAARLQPAATTPGHLSGTIVGGGDFKSNKKMAYETAPDGNAVVLEEQMMKVGKNAGDFQTITNLYRKQIGMFKTVLGRGGG